MIYIYMYIYMYILNHKCRQAGKLNKTVSGHKLLVQESKAVARRGQGLHRLGQVQARPRPALARQDKVWQVCAGS